MEKLVYSLGLVAASLGLGIAVQVLAGQGRLGLPRDLTPLRKRLQKRRLELEASS